MTICYQHHNLHLDDNKGQPQLPPAPPHRNLLTHDDLGCDSQIGSYSSQRNNIYSGTVSTLAANCGYHSYIPTNAATVNLHTSRTHHRANQSANKRVEHASQRPGRLQLALDTRHVLLHNGVGRTRKPRDHLPEPCDHSMQAKSQDLRLELVSVGSKAVAHQQLTAVALMSSVYIGTLLFVVGLRDLGRRPTSMRIIL